MTPTPRTSGVSIAQVVVVGIPMALGIRRWEGAERRILRRTMDGYLICS